MFLLIVSLSLAEVEITKNNDSQHFGSLELNSRSLGVISQQSDYKIVFLQNGGACNNIVSTFKDNS